MSGAGALATYTDDVVWDDVANPACPVRGKQETAGMCEGILSAIPDFRLEGIVRFAAGDHVVDESLANGHVHGSFFGVDGARRRCRSGGCTSSIYVTG